jgi:hypothetical protein
VQVDGVLASDNIGNGGTASLGLLGLLGGGHFYVVVGREGGMLVEMLFGVRRKDGLFARFAHEAGEIPSEPWRGLSVTCTFRIWFPLSQPRDQVRQPSLDLYSSQR